MRVLIAIDSSVYSAQVLESLTARRWSDHTELKVISVVEPCPPSPDTEEQCLHQSRLILNQRVSALRKALPNLNITEEALVGNASTTIIKTAEEWKATLIVIGSHGDTGPRKSHIGSVAAAVVNQAPCTVELVKIYRVTSGHKKEHASAAAR